MDPYRAFLADHSTPSQSASRRENAYLLADAIAQLPENYRIRRRR